MTVAVVAISVLTLCRRSNEVVDRSRHAAGAHRRLVKAEAADIDARAERVGVVARGRDEINGATKRVGAEAQCVGTLVHLDIAIGRRIDLEQIEKAIRGVDRDAVHVHVDAAVAIVTRQPGAADRNPAVDVRLGLNYDARHPSKGVLDRICRRVLEGRVGHDLDAAGCALDLGRGFRRRRHRQAACALGSDTCCG
jgi:hypothetical protein